MTTIVFLHIPKTAGQTVHNVLIPVVGGADHVSPIRVHTQAPNGPQMPAGYKLYSGHLDFIELDTLPEDRFVFTVLRDPRERIASFFLYLLKEAKELSAEALTLPQNSGMRWMLEWSADEYFTGGNPSWQKFIRDHYDNFYCTYFATGMVRGNSLVEGLSQDALLERAMTALAKLDGVYSTRNLGALENDIEARLGKKINLIKAYHNEGPTPRNELRWPKLMKLVEKDETRALLERFVEDDNVLMKRIGMA